MSEADLDAAVRRVLTEHTKESKKAPADIRTFRDRLAFMLVGSFIATLPVLLFKNIPRANEQIITYILGQMSGMALTVIGFYFISKAGEEEKDAKRENTTNKAITALSEANTQIANAASGNGGVVDGANAVADAAQNKANEIAEGN